MPDVLREAQITVGKRAIEYEHPRENFLKITKAWSAYLGREITNNDFVNLMILLKVMRDSSKHIHDNHVDIAGYLCALDMCYEYNIDNYLREEERYES